MRIGPYEVLAKAGEGGMGAVYRARDPRLGRDLAIKVMSVAASTDAARFATEMQALARLSHPHIVAVHAAGVDGGKPFVAMQWVDGEDLRARLRRVGPFPEPEARRVVAAVARALEYAHGQGVVHRDVKPENVLVAADGHVLLADFGLARIVGRETRVTVTGEIVGTPAYAAPEQAAGDTAAIGPATDVWALGALLFELLTGHGPFTRGSLVGTLEAVLTAPAPSAVALRPELDPRLEALVRRCLEKAPARRPTAGEVAAALETDAPTRPARAPSRLVPALATAAALAVGVAALALVTRPARPQPPAPASPLKVETPRLELESPPDGAEVASPVRVRGRVTPAGAGLRVRLRDRTLTPAADGTFDDALDELPLGEHTLEAVALRGDEAVTAPARARVRVVPGWLRRLPAEERPAAIPEGVTPLARPGCWCNEADGSVLRWVPPGTFDVATGVGPRSVEVPRGFFISDPITCEQARAFAGATARRHPLMQEIEPAPLEWVDAQEYCRWAGARLATGPEWYLARDRSGWSDGPREWLQDRYEPGSMLGIAPTADALKAREHHALAEPRAPDDERAPPVVSLSQRGGVAFRIVVDAASRALPPARWTVEAFSLTPGRTAPPEGPAGAMEDLRLASPHRLGPFELRHLDLRFDGEGPGQLLLPPGERSTFPKEWFAVVATTRVTLPAGRYTLYARSDDGVRVFLDGQPAIDAWVHRVATTLDLWPFEVPTPRTVEVRVEYCELVGSASLTAGVCPD